MKKLLIPLSYLAQIIVLIGLIFFDGFGQQGFVLLYLIPFAILNLALRNQISNKNLRLLHVIINVISIFAFGILMILSFVFPVSNKYIILQTKKHSLSLIVISCVLFFSIYILIIPKLKIITYHLKISNGLYEKAHSTIIKIICGIASKMHKVVTTQFFFTNKIAKITNHAHIENGINIVISAK